MQQHNSTINSTESSSPINNEVKSILWGKTKSFYIQLDPVSIGIADLSEMQTSSWIPLPDETWYYFNRLVIPTKFRNRGNGHKLMKKVIEWADQNKISIYLDASPYDGPEALPKLISFYFKHGFTLWQYNVMLRLATNMPPTK